MINNLIILDSSVFLKQFLNENDREIAVDFIRQKVSQDCQIMVPDLFYYEVLSVAAIHRRFEEIYEAFTYYEKNILKIIRPNIKITALARKITEKGHNKSGFPSFYDAIYHALAIENDCYFITTDKKHYEKARHLGHIKLLGQVA